MSPKAPKALSRTRPDGSRPEPVSEADVVLLPGDEVRALRAALEVILSVDGRRPLSAEKRAATILGTSDEIVSAVAHVVHRAHTALHEAGALSDVRQRRCAEVLFTTLPESVSRRLILADVIEQVHFLARERNAERAIAGATASLLGWTDIAARAVARAVEIVVARSRR